MEEDTKWGGQTLIDAANTFTFQIGNEAGEELAVTMTKRRTSLLWVSLSPLPLRQACQARSQKLPNHSAAIAKVAEARAKLGANSNQLDYAMQHFANTATALKSSLGRIQDTDFAAESTNLAKTQILQQAATSMLAQANASKQSVLQLLQG